MKPVLVFIGRSKSGKDTAYKFITQYVPYVRRIAFADELKRMTANILRITPKELEDNKEKYRELLIYGGQLGRALDPNTWVNLAFETNKNALDKELIVYTDCRFPNEFERICEHYKDRDVYSVYIKVGKEVLLSRGYNPKIWDDPSECSFDHYLGTLVRRKYYVQINNDSNKEEEFHRQLFNLLYSLDKNHGPQLQD